MRDRLLAYARFIDRLGGTLLLFAFWGVLLSAFVAHMEPRFAYLAGKPIAPDMPCGRPQCDFSVFWPAGRLSNLNNFATLYTPAPFNEAVSKLLLPGISYETFFYPPTVLLVLSPLARLPFEVAAFLWLAICILFSIFLLRIAGFTWKVITIGLLSPAALLDYQLGQFGVLMGAILLASVKLEQRRPWLGGESRWPFRLEAAIGTTAPVFLAPARKMDGFGGVFYHFSRRLRGQRFGIRHTCLASVPYAG